MSCRCSFFLLICCLFASPVVRAQHTVAEQYLFLSINAERQQAGLPALTWNDTLTDAARNHAVQMRAAQTISHQFQGEPDLAQRAATSGTHFSRVSENVATSPSIVQMHGALMQSPMHRANILDPHVNAVGISVVASGRQLWGVEDFALEVAPLSYDEQEMQVIQLVQAAGIASTTASAEARSTCQKSTGYTGERPAFVMRFSATDLNQLPHQLLTRIAQGGIYSASVGACDTQAKSSFSTYNIAVLLYR